MRVRLTVMLDLGTMTALEIERLRDDMRQLDFASLHGVTQEGIDPEPIASGGFNLESLRGWDGAANAS